MIHGILYFCVARPFKGQNQGLYEPDQTADSLLRSRCADWCSGFFLLKSSGNLSLAALGMMAVMLPLFFLAMYEKDGQPLEVVAKHFYEAKFKRPKTRPYKTKNYYALLVQQADVEMEVNRIVQNGKKQERQSGAGISITAAMTRQRSFLRRVWRRSCC